MTVVPDHPPSRCDGSRNVHPVPRNGTRLLRYGQPGRCRDCGNAVEWYYRPGHRPVPLHPSELPAEAVPELSRWHVAAGVAYPTSDGSAWCRLPHAALCPARAPIMDLPDLSGLRRALTTRTRRLIGVGTITPTSAPGPVACRPARPVVQILGIRYVAARPVEEIACLAPAATTKARCSRTLAHIKQSAGVWRLLPATATAGQLALPAGLTMAVYDLAALPYAEQLRWRAQRCTGHTTRRTEMAMTEWEPFEPHSHREHIHPRLPSQHPTERSGGQYARRCTHP
ncbi:DUF6083 domain-containing protein [Streptomyces fildesensis]|uniref:DUF6083 domain-containing protein n=1 Tax=Streptomyces fildesensis TaxID=375757 RepID=UPI001E3FE39D|nr:DUF6083 domain-containing protein [Streptomyces fildesensis]